MQTRAAGGSWNGVKLRENDDDILLLLVETKESRPATTRVNAKIREKFREILTERIRPIRLVRFTAPPPPVSGLRGTLTRHHPAPPTQPKVTDVRRKTKTGNERAASAWTKMAGREAADWRDGDGRGVVSVRHVPPDRSYDKNKDPWWPG